MAGHREKGQKMKLGVITMNQSTEKPPRVLRKKEMLHIVALSDPTVWRMEKDGKFPKRLRLGGNSCGWLESDVLAWLDARLAAREA